MCGPTDKYILYSDGINRTPTCKVGCKIRRVTDTHDKMYTWDILCASEERINMANEPDRTALSSTLHPLYPEA
jgi:hypothetical protein